jgi:hypothetical protein
MENPRNGAENIYRKVVAVAVGSALALGIAACSGGSDSETATKDTATYVAVDAYTGELGSDVEIDTGAITESVLAVPIPGSTYDASDEYAKDPHYTTLKNIDPRTHEDTQEFENVPSAPVLTIKLNKKHKLVYKDATPDDLSEEERKLLAATNANAALLAAALAGGGTRSLQFRIYDKPMFKSDEFPQTDFGIHIGKDSNDKGRPNTYYFLPADAEINTQAVQALVGHEVGHAALERANENTLTAKQRAGYNKACSTLRDIALNEMASSAEYDLYLLWENAPARLKPAYDTVIRALDRGTYAKLPAPLLDPSEVAPCFVENPIVAVRRQAQLRGVEKLFNKQMASSETDDPVADINDNWSDDLEDRTIYAYVKEGTWLTGEENKEKGHPQDGRPEIATSTLNRLMNDPEQFGSDLAHVEPKGRRALNKILDIDVAVLKDKYPNERNLFHTIDARRGLFNKALNQ